MSRLLSSLRPRRAQLLWEATEICAYSRDLVRDTARNSAAATPAAAAVASPAATPAATQAEPERAAASARNLQQQEQAQQPAPRMERKPLAPPGYSRTFYKRQLPTPPAIEFASDQGKQVFAQALTAGTMNNFFKLIEQFRTQDEPAYCGLASLAMVLNTLNIDPRRTWKGPWRWFHEEMLDCCHPLPKVREEGITLTQAACLARCNGARVELYPHGAVSVQEFRGMVAEACATADEHIIVSYSRREFLQTGDGHFSPIGGFCQANDMVLILDTARFKYPPHWVPLEMLYNAMARVDPATGRPRGFMRMGRHPRLDSVLFTLDVRDAAWREANGYLRERMGGVIASAAAEPGASAGSIVAAAAAAVPLPALRKFVAVRTAGSSTHGGVCIQTAAVHTFLRELRGMPLFASVTAALPPATPRSRHVDEVPATNCYTGTKAGCWPAPNGTASSSCCDSGSAAGAGGGKAAGAAGSAAGGAAGAAAGGAAGVSASAGRAAGGAAAAAPELAMAAAAPGGERHAEQQWDACAVQSAQQAVAGQQAGPEGQPDSQPGVPAALPAVDMPAVDMSSYASSDSLAATAAASSSPALAASAAEPAVKEDLSVERACILLLMAPKETWLEVGDEKLRQEVLALLDVSLHSVVAAEVEYLAAQLWQLPILEEAREQSQASGHTCAVDTTCHVCGISSGSSSEGEEEEEQRQQQQQEQQRRQCADALEAAEAEGGGSGGGDEAAAAEQQLAVGVL